MKSMRYARIWGLKMGGISLLDCLLYRRDRNEINRLAVKKANNLRSRVKSNVVQIVLAEIV